MKAGSSSEKYEVVAEINMIPFIDIALVLLIIFMVMTPYLVKEQIKINPPKIKSTGADVNKHALVQIDVTREGSYYVNGEATSAEGVYEIVQRRLKDPENQQVVVAADKDVVFDRVVQAMDAAKRAGATKIGVEVKHEGSAAPGGGSSRRSARTRP
ncbi:MAG: biopolymer transporter ExbD [bacterium]